MSIIFAILFVAALGFAIFLLFKNRQLEEEVLRVNNWAQNSVADAQKSADLRVAEVTQQSQTAVAEAQKLIGRQFADMQQEAERIKQHYEIESRKAQEAADALVTKIIQDFEPLRKYEKIRDAETEARRELADALKEATSLRVEAQSLLDEARNAADTERSLALERARENGRKPTLCSIKPRVMRDESWQKQRSRPRKLAATPPLLCVTSNYWRGLLRRCAM